MDTKSYTLNLKRNGTLFESYEAALEGLKTQLTQAKDGEPIIARYQNGEGIVKTLRGIACTVGETTTYDIDEMYDTNFKNLVVPSTVGGIKANTPASELAEKNISEVLDMILFPEMNPTITAPSATISFKTGTFTNGNIYEAGAVAPVIANFNTAFNRGKGVVAGKNEMFRAGELVTANSFIYYGGNVATKTLPAKVTLGNMAYNYHAAYGVGDTLVTSYGNVATKNDKNEEIVNPLTSGSVNSTAVQIYGTYPYFCNGASASSSNQDNAIPSQVTPDTKLPLIKWDSTLIGAKFASEAATNTRFTFDFPAVKKISKVEFMNTVSGKWETFNGYEVADIAAKTIQGNSVNYKRWTTVSSLNGGLQLRFTIANA